MVTKTIRGNNLYDTERYIRSTFPTLWISGKKDWQGSGKFLSDDGYGHACTVSGDVTRTGQGPSFGGTDGLITIPDANPLDLTTAITIELYLKEITSKSQYGLVGKRDNYELAIVSDKLNFYYLGATAQVWSATTWDFTTGLWTHLVLSYTFGTATVSAYANNVLMAGSWTTGSGAGTPSANANDVTLGWTFNRSVYGNILIGEARVYPRALSAAEAQRNYLATVWRNR